jgi:hypothetical protein
MQASGTRATVCGLATEEATPAAVKQRGRRAGMRRVFKHALRGCAAALSLSWAISSASAAIVSVDGSLADWGVAVAPANASSFGVPANSSGTRVLSGFSYQYQVEDQSDSAGHTGFLGPEYGGQDYDAEFLGAGVDNGRLVIAIVTGQRPDNGTSFFGPGDIRIMTNIGTFGVEVGGEYGHNGGAASAATTEGALGSTYKLDASGVTLGVRNSNGATSGNATGLVSNVGQQAGSVWLNPTWINDPIANPPTTPTQMQFTGGTLMGLADYYFSRDAGPNDHAIIELAIPYAFFGDGVIVTGVQWAPSCGNDIVQVATNYRMPEPATFGMLLIGALGAVVIARRRNGA